MLLFGYSLMSFFFLDEVIFLFSRFGGVYLVLVCFLRKELKVVWIGKRRGSGKT